MLRKWSPAWFWLQSGSHLERLWLLLLGGEGKGTRNFFTAARGGRMQQSISCKWSDRCIEWRPTKSSWWAPGANAFLFYYIRPIFSAFADFCEDATSPFIWVSLSGHLFLINQRSTEGSKEPKLSPVQLSCCVCVCGVWIFLLYIFVYFEYFYTLQNKNYYIYKQW